MRLKAEGSQIVRVLLGFFGRQLGLTEIQDQQQGGDTGKTNHRMNHRHTILRFLLIASLLCGTLVTAQNTYYISSSAGDDTRTAVQARNKNTPWAKAPGMRGQGTGPTAYSGTPGDIFIFKGCDVWTWDAFPWFILTASYGGTTGAGTRYQFLGDIDTTWYNTANCPSGWSRPVLDNCKVSAPPSGNLPTCSGANLAEIPASPFALYNGDFVVIQPNYVTVEGFEFRNHYANGTNGDIGSGQYAAFKINAQDVTNTLIKNNYYHAWITEKWSSNCTGTSGSNILTCTSTTGARVTWPIQMKALNGTTLPFTGNGPTITAVTDGTHLTVSENVQDSGCTSPCATWAGADALGFLSGGNYPDNIGLTLDSNVISGYDTAEVQADTACATPGTYPTCLSSGRAFWRGNILTNNWIEYMPNGYIGEAQIWGGNMVQYQRNSTNPTQHQNAFENNGDPVTGTIMYNSLFRHIQVGLPVQLAPRATAAACTYVFNTVFFDGLANISMEFGQALDNPNGCMKLFSSTVEGGPDSGPIYAATNCPAGYSGCTIRANHWITSATAISTCGGNCTADHNITQSKATANGQGYTSAQTFAFSPTLVGNSTVGAGINLGTLCGEVSALNATAGTACLSDTAYAIGLDAATHTVVIPGRTANVRNNPSDASAFEFASGAAATAALTATPSVIKQGLTSTLASTCTNSASASIDQGVGAVSATTANTTVSPTTATTYTLTCTPSVGSAATATATVTIGGCKLNPGTLISGAGCQ